MHSAFTYAAVGATEHGLFPEGFSSLRVRTRVGSGPLDEAVAARAVMDWHMHRAMGVRMDTSSASAAPGVDVTVGLGVGGVRLRAPCRVVWTVEEERRAGWGYGTLPGHPVSGEEAFVVDRDPSGTVWLTVSAFSLPANRWTRAGRRLLPYLQRLYAYRCGAVLRRLVRRQRAGAGE